jgi:hypothetical protein
VLLPGVSVPARQVTSVRQVAEKRLYATVAGAARRVDASLSGGLVALLEEPEGRRISELERAAAPTADADDGREPGEGVGAGG